MEDQLLGWKMQEQIPTQSTTCSTTRESQLLKAAFAGYYLYLAFTAENVLKPCPHWRRYSSETATNCRQTIR